MTTIAASVVVHVGLQKSGTTYLQHGMAQRADELAKQGIHYPVTTRSGVPNHQPAVYDLLVDEMAIARARGGSRRGAWPALRRALDTHLDGAPGRVVLSAEILSLARRTGARTFLDAVGCEETHVVVTARSLAKMLPSAWQQSLRAGRTSTLGHYLRRVAEDRARLLAMEDPHDEPGSPWRAFSAAGQAQLWSSLVGPERVVLATSGPPPQERLWTRFLSAVGVEDPAALPVPQLNDVETHSGLRRGEAEVVAALNAALAKAGWDAAEASRLRTSTIAALVDRPDRGPSVRLPKGWDDAVAEWTRQEVEVLGALGVRVAGDLQDLLHRAAPVGEDGPQGPGQPVDDVETARAAAAALLAAARATPAATTAEPPPPSADGVPAHVGPRPRPSRPSPLRRLVRRRPRG